MTDTHPQNSICKVFVGVVSQKCPPPPYLSLCLSVYTFLKLTNDQHASRPTSTMHRLWQSTPSNLSSIHNFPMMDYQRCTAGFGSAAKCVLNFITTLMEQSFPRRSLGLCGRHRCSPGDKCVCQELSSVLMDDVKKTYTS